MARSAATVIENNFVKGLITEATGLNYPENSCIETWDCEFDFFGRVSRRLAFDLEYGFLGKAVSKVASVIKEYHWKNVTGDGLKSFIVTQIGSTLYFYDTTNPSSLSNSLIASTINLLSFSSGGPAANLNECQFADGLGKLYVFHPYLENFYVTYDAATNTMTATQYSLTLRDFEGAYADPYLTDQRPGVTMGTMSADHKYNLFNQGWCKADLATPELTAWDAARTDMPSNCDVWWNFKTAADVFDVATVANSGRGNSPAAKGHFILNVYNQDRSTASGLTITATSSGTARTSTGAFHAGRVFYAGINATTYVSKIYFSQIIERNSQIGACYQISDPTSEDLFDLLPADGGVISIPEAGTIYKLFSVPAGLLVFAYRGVYMISGSQGIGFSATDFTISKLSSIRTVSASSFVDVNGVPMWWNTDGIFTCQSAQGGMQVQSMSISTMQTFFNEIPNASKLTVKGYFNPLAQTVQWLFRTTAPSTVEEQYAFDAILNYNVLTSAFFPWSVSPGATVHGLIVVDGVGGQVQEAVVVNNASVQVVDNLGNNLAAYLLTNTSVQPKTKFLVSYNSGGTKFTWAETNGSTYLDWSALAVRANYTSYFITGYRTHGNAQTKFQPTYTYVYHEGTGQAYIQGIWDFAVSPNTGRYSTKQLLTFTNANYSNNHKRVKIRGQGLTLQYYVRSLPGQPFTIVGWSTFETGNQQV